MQQIIGFAALLAAGLAVYLAVLVWFTAVRLRRPPKRTYGWAVSRGVPGDPSELGPDARPFEPWTLSRAGLDMPVWDVPGDDPAGPVVVVTHGWASSRVDMLSRLPTLARAASRVVLWDMPGHGEAGGVCRLAAREPADLAALLERVGEPVVLYGYSLGAEVSLLAAGASPVPVRGLILEAPYRVGVTPAWNLLGATRMPRLINLPVALALLGLIDGNGPAWRWRDNARPAADLALPTLVLHGDADEMCPPADGESLAAAAGGRFVAIAGAGHQDIWTGPGREAADRAVAVFLAEIAAADTVTPSASAPA